MNVFKKGCRPQGILDAVSASRTVLPGGGVAVRDGFTSEKWLHLIASYISDERHPLERLEAVSMVIDLQQDWTPESFSKAYKSTAESIEKSRRSYICVLPLSGSSNLLDLLSTQMKSHQNLVKHPFKRREIRISRERARLKDSYDFKEIFIRQLHYPEDAQLHIRVKASSAAHAQDLASEEAAVALGLNAFATNFTIARAYAGIHQPIGELLLAPCITVHELSGKLSAETFWYNSWTGPHNGGGTSDKAIEFSRRLIKLYSEALSRSFWRTDCERLLRMYFDFVSEPDRRSAFLAGWNILEFLLSDNDNTTSKTSYDIVIERACCFYADKGNAGVMGAYIRDTRNRLAHGHSAPLFDSSETLYSLMNFLRPVMKAFIVNYYRLRNREEFLNFCDLAARDDRLDDRLSRSLREIELIEAARKFTKR